MKNRRGNTAFGAAAVRLIEQYEPEDKRLFNDPVVYHLTFPLLRFLLKFKFMRDYYIRLSDKIIPGIIGGQICRTKFIDDKTLSVLKDMEQILILGAGLDTRAYRLKGIEQKIIFEIDLPDVQRYKKQKLVKYLGKLPVSVKYIPIDFNKTKIESVLDNSSFNFNKRTLVIFEAVTQYITADAVDEVFKFISKLPNNSYLLFTYVLKDAIERKTESAKKLMDWSEKKKYPFIFGINPSEIASFLKGYSLEIIEDVGTEFYQEKYLKPVNRNIVILEAERSNFSKLTK